MTYDEYQTQLQDPAYRTSVVTGGKPAPTAEGANLMWSSAMPDYGYYSPGGGAAYQEINEGSLSDPTIAKAVADRAHSATGADAAYWNTMGGKIPEGVGLGPNDTGSLMEGMGSSFSLAPEVLAKMWQPPQQEPIPTPPKFT